jgi:hypothetical protein
LAHSFYVQNFSAEAAKKYLSIFNHYNAFPISIASYELPKLVRYQKAALPIERVKLDF